MNENKTGHNPYFNRWFSAIISVSKYRIYGTVTILILIDGFLQFIDVLNAQKGLDCHNPYFNRWFSAMI